VAVHNQWGEARQCLSSSFSNSFLMGDTIGVNHMVDPKLLMFAAFIIVLVHFLMNLAQQ